jgi:hypothetical protein
MGASVGQGYLEEATGSLLGDELILPSDEVA